LNRRFICYSNILLFFLFFIVLAPSLYAQHGKLLNVKKTGERNFTYRKITKIEKISAKQETNQALKIWLADAYLMVNDYNAALPVLEEVVQFKNISPDYHHKLAQTYLFFNLQDKAVNQLKFFGSNGEEQIKILEVKSYIQPANVTINPLSLINSSQDELSAGLYSGKIIFSYSKPRKLRFLESKDIYFSTLMSKGLIVDKVYPYNDNKRLKDGFALSSTEGSLVLNNRNKRRFFKIEKPTIGLYFKEGESKKLNPFKFNNFSYNILNPYLADGGNLLFFSSNMLGGKGGYDLYYCQRHDGGWSYPKNLGEKINTFADEMYPCFVDSTLYFSSNGLPGFGNMDVFYSKITKEGFLEPQNMGTPINSPNNDVGFYIEQNKSNAIISSDRSSGRGGKDLYVIRFE
jgi:hypothetical protein